MITIKVLAFGIARDILKLSNVQWDLENPTKVGDFKAHLIEKHPMFGKLASIKLAVNESYVEDEYTIQDQDEIAIIPPVSGG